MGKRRRQPDSRLGAFGARVLYWLPVAVAFAFFAHVGLRGLRPSLAETQRLSAVEEQLRARYDTALEEEQQWDRLLRAQQDPIYLERERRMLHAPRPTGE